MSLRASRAAALRLPPVVLDLDGSVGPLPGERRLALGDWQETMRFGCTLAQMMRFRDAIQPQLPAPADRGTVLMGSGDFHHLSWPLIAHLAQAGTEGNARPWPERSLRVVVLDNHPDNMRFPFGVHCGSWVSHVASHPAVGHVHVVGITSPDIGLGHAWENRLAPLRAGKLSYWSVGVDTTWSRWLGIASAFRNFDCAEHLADTLCTELQAAPQATYLSIDKDVFAADVVRTNWDQGQLQEAQANRVIAALQGQIYGSDITGDVSAYRYRTAWKRCLSHADAQETEIEPALLQSWQQAQHALNRRLVARIASASAFAAGNPSAGSVPVPHQAALAASRA